eukprot:m.182571 g.182571  ORF g.182571 m.182571 type:complete len:1357 (+) comp24645_c0_seq1:133-4203(+)
MQRVHGGIPGEHVGPYSGAPDDGWPDSSVGQGSPHTAAHHGYTARSPHGAHVDAHHQPGYRGVTASQLDMSMLGGGGGGPRVTLPPLHPQGGNHSPATERAALPRAVWTSGSPYIPRRLGEGEATPADHQGGAHGGGRGAPAGPLSHSQRGGSRDHAGDLSAGHAASASAEDHRNHNQHHHSAPQPGRHGWSGQYVQSLNGESVDGGAGGGAGGHENRGGHSAVQAMLQSSSHAHTTASASRMAQIGAAFDSEVSHFRQQCSELQADRDALAVTNTALHSRIENDARLAGSLYEVREAKTIVDQQLAVTTAQLEAQSTLAQQLQAANNGLVAERSALTADKVALEQEREVLTASTQANRVEADGLIEVIAAEKRGATELQTSLEAARVQCAELEQGNVAALAQCGATATELASTAAKLVSEEAVTVGLRADLERECRLRDEAAAKSLSTAVAQHDSAQSKLQAELHELKTVLEQRHEAAITAAARYASELATTRAESESKLVAQTVELHAFNSVAQSTQGEMTALRHEMAQMRQTLMERQTEIDSLKTKVVLQQEREQAVRLEAAETATKLCQFMTGVATAVGSAPLGEAGADSETEANSQADVQATDVELERVTNSVSALAERLCAAVEFSLEAAAAAAQVGTPTPMIELADAEARVAAVAKTLVDEIQSLTHTPQTVAPASSAALLERMEGLRAMCADGEHSAGEADSWAWGGFNSVVVAAADVTITTLRATAAIVEAADPEGAAAAKEELTAIRAKASALLNAVGADSADGDGLADRFAIANTKVAALQAGADMAASLASELAAAKVSLELAAFAGSKEQILNDRTALAAANASEAALADEVADLREKLVSADDMVAQLRDEVEVLDENSMVKVAQVRDMEGQVAQLEAEIASALTHTTELGDALTLAQHELASDDLRTQLETAEKEIVRLKKLLTDTNDARHNRLENENHGLRKAVDSANSERDTAVAARDRKAQSDAKDIAIEKSIRLQLAREKDEIQARLDKLIGADQFTEVLQQEKAYLEERVEELEHELAEQTARVAEIEIEMEEIGKRAAEEIQMRTAGAADKMQELEDERDSANAKYTTAEAARVEGVELARANAETIEDLEKKLRITQAKIDKSSSIEDLKAETYRITLDRYEQTLSALATVLNLNLEPLQRDIIEAPLDPDVRPKDTWDPHCDRIDKALHQKVTSLHEHIADIPNQIAAVEAAGAAESAKQKIQFERVIAQMKTKLIRKEAMFDALTKQLDEVDNLKLENDLEKKRVAQGQQELARIREKLRVQRDEIEQLDAQLLDERALKEALIKRMEVASTSSKSVTRASRVTTVDPGLAVSLRSDTSRQKQRVRPRPPPK